MTLALNFDLLQGQICCRAGDHNSSNLLVKFAFKISFLVKGLRSLGKIVSYMRFNKLYNTSCPSLKLIFCVFTDDYDAYIIVSFVNATLVLSIGETVEEVTDSGFLGTTPTLSCSQLGDDALVQVSIYHSVLYIGLPW